MTWEEMEAMYKKEFPKLKIRSFEENWLLRTLSKKGWGMAGITLYNTVFLRKDYMGNQRGINIMKHEIQHVRDVHDWHIFYLLSYIFLFPTVLAMRAFWEWRGYREDLESVWYEYKDADPAYREYILEYYAQWVTSQFTGASYFYMFPFRNKMYSICQNFYKKLK